MATRSASALDFAPSGGDSTFESTFEASTLERALGHRLPRGRWIGWRLRLLVGCALAGCLGLFALLHLAAAIPHLPAQWRANPQDRLELVSTPDSRLEPLIGQALVGVSSADGPMVALDGLALQRSPRWLVSEVQRRHHAVMQDQLAGVLQQREVLLHFADGSTLAMKARPRGPGGLGLLFWMMSALALLLYLLGMVVLLARPSLRNATYALSCLCQAGNLLFIALESLPGLGLPRGFAHWDLLARMAFDLLTAASIAHASAFHPRLLPGRHAIGTLAWLVALVPIGLVAAGQLPHPWWWTQGTDIAFGLAVIGLYSWSYRIEPHPIAAVLRRFAVAATATLLLLTIAIAAADRVPGVQFSIAGIGSVIWYVFLASLLLMVPFLSRSQQLMREFSMLAGISTVATSLDLLFLAVFALGQFASLTLALFLSLGAYAGARQWILNQMLGNHMLTTERMFEQLYRIAREIEAQPQKTGELLSRLLRELFEPLELTPLQRRLNHARVLTDGSTLVVPVPVLDKHDADTQPAAVMLRFAQRGKRMFTQEDARLTDRIVEQLKRAVAFDQAVEQGRSEERARIAQDLHDDIGARLLTLMYKAPSPDVEDYLRHTLQDLKTLTRGLAASSHRLSHAAAEWKADISQRLSAAHCNLRWSFSCDRDLVLNVVQWSALTRMLRELVSNIISHSQATQVDVEIALERDVFTLRVADDGVGNDPATWSHGLGLGGVRKRVKQLGGEVEWRENTPRGIVCRVRIPELSVRR